MALRAEGRLSSNTRIWPVFGAGRSVTRTRGPVFPLSVEYVARLLRLVRHVCHCLCAAEPAFRRSWKGREALRRAAERGGGIVEVVIGYSYQQASTGCREKLRVLMERQLGRGLGRSYDVLPSSGPRPRLLAGSGGFTGRCMGKRQAPTNIGTEVLAFPHSISY